MSRQSANDTVNNEGAVYRSRGIYLAAEENPGDRLMKTVRPVNYSNAAFYLQMRSVGSHSTSEGRKKERTGMPEERIKTATLQVVLYVISNC